MPLNDSGAAPEKSGAAMTENPTGDPSTSFYADAEAAYLDELRAQYGSDVPSYKLPGTLDFDVEVTVRADWLQWKAAETAESDLPSMEPRHGLPSDDQVVLVADAGSGTSFMLGRDGTPLPVDHRVEFQVAAGAADARRRHEAGRHGSAIEHGCLFCEVDRRRRLAAQGKASDLAPSWAAASESVEARWRAFHLSRRPLARDRDIVPPAAVRADNDSADSWHNRTADIEAALAGTVEAEVPNVFFRSDDHALLYPGRTHSLSGEPESGKSWCALIPAADALSAGERVLFLDGESDAATVVGRLRVLGVSDESIRVGLTYVRPPGPPDASADALAAWEALLATRYELAVIDGVTEFLARWGVESIDNDAVTRWYREVPHRLAERTGAAVALVDHVTKSQDGRGRFAIGAQAKLASLSGAAYLVEVVDPIGVGQLGRVALRVAKDRPGGVRPHCGTFRHSDRTQEAAVITLDSREPGRTAVTVDPPRGIDGSMPTTFRPTVLMERVSRLLVAGGPTSRKGIESAVTGKATAVRTAIDVLIAEGFASADGPALHGHPSIQSVKPFTNDSDGTP